MNKEELFKVWKEGYLNDKGKDELIRALTTEPIEDLFKDD